MKKNQIILLGLTVIAVELIIFLVVRVGALQVFENNVAVGTPIVVNGPQASVQTNFNETAQVIRIVDGDTIEINIGGQQKKLRYIGINTPETVDPRRGVQCFGKEASNQNKSLVENKTVYLDKDVSETDKFGRLLRFVYLKLDDGNFLFVNDYLVRQGFAYADRFPPDVKYADRFLAGQHEAEQNKRGLWNNCPASR